MVVAFILAVAGSLILGWVGARLWDWKTEEVAPPQIHDIGFYKEPTGGYVGWIETSLATYFIDEAGGIKKPRKDKVDGTK